MANQMVDGDFHLNLQTKQSKHGQVPLLEKEIGQIESRWFQKVLDHPVLLQRTKIRQLSRSSQILTRKYC